MALLSGHLSSRVISLKSYFILNHFLKIILYLTYALFTAQFRFLSYVCFFVITYRRIMKQSQTTYYLHNPKNKFSLLYEHKTPKHNTTTDAFTSSHNIPALTRPRGLYQPFKYGTEELLNKHLLLIVVETGQLSPEGLAEEVCFHPRALHQDFLIVEHLEEQNLLSAEGYRLNGEQTCITSIETVSFCIFLDIFCAFINHFTITINQQFNYKSLYIQREEH